MNRINNLGKSRIYNAIDGLVVRVARAEEDELGDPSEYLHVYRGSISNRYPMEGYGLLLISAESLTTMCIHNGTLVRADSVFSQVFLGALFEATTGEKDATPDILIFWDALEGCVEVALASTYDLDSTMALLEALSHYFD